MLDLLPRPAVIAHRGASAYAPENTLAAFRKALKQGADAIELDVKLSHDREIVVIHDRTVDRTTDGFGAVADLTLAELKRLKAAYTFGAPFTGEGIPTLGEVLEAVGGRIPLNIELANYAHPWDSLPERVAGLVVGTGLQRYILFSSFNPWALIRLRRAMPQAEVALLAQPGPAGRWARSPLGRLVRYQALHPHFSDVDVRLVARLHRQGRRLHPYTVNPETELIALFNMGVDGLFTDDPPLACRVRASLATPTT